MDGNIEAVARAARTLFAHFSDSQDRLAPMIDLVVLVAQADGVVDADEMAAITQTISTFLDGKLRSDVVRMLVESSREALDSDEGGARRDAIRDALVQSEAVEDGLTLAIALGFASGGLSREERAVIDAMAATVGLATARVDALVAKVRGAFEKPA